MTIEQLADRTYDDDAVKQYILQEVHKSGTAERILKGELVLPHPHDAAQSMRVANGEETKWRPPQ